MFRLLALAWSFLGIYSASGQYPFLKKNLNQVEYVQGLDHFLAALDSLALGLKHHVNIVHIGDSHIQADYYSGQVRTQLQARFGNGGRGFVFPYKLLKTNQPETYKIQFTGIWGGCRSVRMQPGCHLGLSGLCAFSTDPSSSLIFDFSKTANDLISYTADSVIFFQPTPETDLPYHLNICQQPLVQPDFTYRFEVPRPTYTTNFSWDFYGALVYQRSPGIVYHSLGLNGADVSSYLRCDLLPYQLPYLQADLVIVSLGTNDAYRAPFDTSSFSSGLDAFLGMIRQACPNASILLVSPADSYRRYRRRVYDNLDMLRAGEILRQKAQGNGFAFWDFYRIMGGKNSMGWWKRSALAQPDGVHFTPAGYRLQGDLLFEALINAYENTKP